MAEVTLLNWIFDGARGHVHVDIDGTPSTIVFEHEDRWEPNQDEPGLTTWCWDGDREEPTLSPSIKMHDAHFHIRDGEIEAA